MTDTCRELVRPVLASLKGGLLTDQQALELLVAVGISPRVAGILLRQSRGIHPAGQGLKTASHPLIADPLPLGA